MSKDYYENIVNDYKDISNKRHDYIKGVNQILIDHQKNKKTSSWLDIGCGDGNRTLSLQKSIKADHIDVIDNERMLEKLEQSDNFQKEKISLNKGSFSNVTFKKKFDIITFLWNVLGHAGKELERVEFLKKASNHLSQNGIIFFDINNRYNIVEYGAENVERNIKIDLMDKNEAGYFRISHNKISTEVYIHHPYEIEYLIKKYELDLRVESKTIVSYSSGKRGKSIFDGQLVYLLKHEKR